MKSKLYVKITPFASADWQRWFELISGAGAIESFQYGYDGSFTAINSGKTFREYTRGNATIREIDYGYKIARHIELC